MNNYRINIWLLFVFLLLKVTFAKAQNQKGEWTFGFSSGYIISDNHESYCETCGDKYITTSQNYLPFRISMGYIIKKSVSIPILLTADKIHFKINGLPDMYSNPNKIEIEDWEKSEINIGLSSGIFFNIKQWEKKRISIFFLASCALTKVYNNRYFYYYTGNAFVEKGRDINAPRFIFDAGIKLSLIGESKIKNIELMLFPSQSLDIWHPHQNSFSINFGLMYNFKRKEKIKQE